MSVVDSVEKIKYYKRIIEDKEIQNPERFIKFLIGDYLSTILDVRISCMTYTMMRGTQNTVWNVVLLSKELPNEYQSPIDTKYFDDNITNFVMTMPSHVGNLKRDPNTIFTKVFVMVRNEYFENWDRMRKLVPIRTDKRVHYNFVTETEELDSMF